MKKLLLSGAILIAIITNIHAQWIQQASNITPGYYVPFIDAVNDQVVWGIVADPLAQTNPVAEFTKTVDGGNLWIGGQITNAAGLAPSCIFGLNADTAWVAMWNVSGGAGKILKTEDGGVTWNQQTTALFNAAGNFPNWVYFWDANNGICLGDPTGGYFEIYTTTDGGTNWVRTPDVDIAPEQAGEFGITDVFREFGDSTLYFGTNQGRVYKTADRGLHFTAAQTPFNDFIGAMAFKDANNGLCVSGGATGSTDVAFTTDGGATWALKGTNTGMLLLLGMCYVPGTSGTYFMSTPAAGSVDGTTFSPNDGLSWVPVDNLIHTDIEFVNDSTGWTGSNEFNAPMMKWNTPIVVASDDAASSSIDVPLNTGIGTQNPQATFLNNGLNTQTFDVTMNITGGYTSTKTITGLVLNNTQQVTFDPWTPAAPGIYTITIYTSLGVDTNHNNDTLQANATVYDEFENYGWTSFPDITSGTYGLASAFSLSGSTASSPGTLYAIGGADLAVGGQSTMYAYFDQPATWALSASMPSSKVHFSAQKIGNKIYCAGGFSTGFTPDPNTYVYDIPTTTWSTGTAMPMPVGDYAAGTYNDSLIYYINGFNGAADQDIVQIYNIVTDSWTTGTASGIASEGTRGDIYGDKIVIVGGYNGAVSDQATLGTIDAANPSLITWTPLPAYPGGPVFRAAAGVPFMHLKPIVIFAGGDYAATGVATMRDCWGYDLNLNQWLIGKLKPTATNNLNNFVGLVYNDSLWMASVSGYDGANPSTVNEWLNLGASPPLGINEHNSVSNDIITLYPNPASDMLYISVKENSMIESLKVTDISGRIVNSTVVNKGQLLVKINLNDLGAGVYILNVVKADGTNGGYAKFVKQ